MQWVFGVSGYQDHAQWVFGVSGSVRIMRSWCMVLDAQRVILSMLVASIFMLTSLNV